MSTRGRGWPRRRCRRVTPARPRRRPPRRNLTHNITQGWPQRRRPSGGWYQPGAHPAQLAGPRCRPPAWRSSRTDGITKSWPLQSRRWSRGCHPARHVRRPSPGESYMHLQPIRRLKTSWPRRRHCRTCLRSALPNVSVPLFR